MDLAYNRSMDHQAYDRLVQAGPDGMSVTEFSAAFAVTALDGRSIVRNLCRSGYVFHYVMDKHRQRVTK